MWGLEVVAKAMGPWVKFPKDNCIFLPTYILSEAPTSVHCTPTWHKQLNHNFLLIRQVIWDHMKCHAVHVHYIGHNI